VNFHTLDQQPSEESRRGRRLVEAAKDTFAVLSIAARSPYVRAALLFPSFRPLVRLAANLLPDKYYTQLVRVGRAGAAGAGLRRASAAWSARPAASRCRLAAAAPQCRLAIRAASQQLLDDWKASRADGDAAGAPLRTEGGVRPGSFMGLLLEARHKQQQAARKAAAEGGKAVPEGGLLRASAWMVRCVLLPWGPY
jgi:hypothetical protein